MCLNEPYFKVRTIVGLIDTGAPGWLITLPSFNRYALNFFGLGQDWRIFLRAGAQIADGFGRT